MVYPGRRREALAITTTREIKRINDFEKCWKIKTNNSKFQLLSISATKPNDVYVDGTRIPFKESATILDLTLTTRGLISHIKTRKATADHQLTKLKSFRSLNTRIQIH